MRRSVHPATSSLLGVATLVFVGDHPSESSYCGLLKWCFNAQRLVQALEPLNHTAEILVANGSSGFEFDGPSTARLHHLPNIDRHRNHHCCSHRYSLQSVRLFLLAVFR